MLIEFSVENFRSIKDKITLSLEATSDKKLNENLSEIQLPKNKTETKSIKLLNSAAIFGPNASGKSNILKAMHYALQIITNSNKNQLGELFKTQPFLLDDNCLDKPSCFDFKFVKDNVQYDYGVKFNNKKVAEEYLYYYPNGRKIVVFERDKNEIKLMPAQTALDVKEEMRRKIYIEEISDNILVLSAGNKIKIEPIQAAFSWLYEETIIIIDELGIGTITTKMIYEKEIAKEKVLKYLRIADSNIQDLQLSSEESIVNEVPPGLEDYLKEKIAREQNLEIDNLTLDLDSVKVTRTKVDEYSIRKGKDKEGNPKDVIFKIKSQESEGTKKYYGIIAPIVYALEHGHLLCFDELDLRLHTNLVKTIVELFASDLNKKGAQLIFTAHDTNLLDTQTLLRRDQIWFTEKQNDGQTELYSLSDFAVRNDKIIEKGYLKGIFGAVPFINMEDILCEDAQ